MPSWAPRPVPTMTAVGVASPSEHGQATISTATAAPTASVAGRPAASQPARVRAATARTTGTNTPATRSASRCTGALEPWAASTRRTIRARAVSAPTRVARTTSRPSRLTVAPVTSSPGPAATGTDSPVSSDRSIEERPSSTTPSVASFSPGRTTNRSPTATCSTGTGTSAPSRSTMAVPEPSSSSRRRAWPERLRARCSSQRPNRIRTTITAATSKYTWAPPGSPGAGSPGPTASSAATDQPQAARVPSDTRVSMVAARWRSPARAARWKPDPAHSTTGVARTAASQAQPGYCRAGNMARASTGAVRAAAASRRVPGPDAADGDGGPGPTA